MKVLLDACVWGGAAAVLTDAGHDIDAVIDWSADPGDQAILRRALEESRIIVTLDKDFGELAIVHRLPHHGIVRLVGISATQQGAVAVEVLTKYGRELEAGAIVTVEPSRVRVRPPEGLDES